VHHLEGHLLSPLLSVRAPRFPFVALLVSGGHTQLMRVEDVGKYALLGETLDDAAGEAFDKTAKLLGLGYPGGPALEKLAMQGAPGRYDLPRPMLSSGNLDFSFSGLKTAVSVMLQGRPAPEGSELADFAASFQAAVVDVLCRKSRRAIALQGIPHLVVCGGVAANRGLRAGLAAAAAADQFHLYIPPPKRCTDNAAMIAAAGWWRLQSDGPTSLAEGAYPNLRLTAS
jgi:N6-L-threonylcarbamoyladenine synthase